MTRAWLRIAVIALILSVATPWSLNKHFEAMQWAESILATVVLVGYVAGLVRDSHRLRLWSLRLGAVVWLAVGYRTLLEGIDAIVAGRDYLNPAALIGVTLLLCGVGAVFVHAAKEEEGADGQ